MISALLLPLFIGAPASAPAPAPVGPAAVASDDPPIRIWINDNGRFLPGDRAKVEVRTKDDGYLIVFHVDPEGHLRVLFPIDPDRDNFARGGKRYEIRGRGGRESFEVDNSTGKGTIYAAVSRNPLRFDGFVLDDHWDYRALAPSRLADDPEPELNELVRRMAQSNFDYDLLNYSVSNRVAYRADYSPWYYDSYYPRYYGSPYGFSVSLFFGHPYRRYYYDPYYYAFYDPFYYPFFYDPYYYAPIYRPRYIVPFPYRYGYYNSRYYYDHGYYYDRYRYRQPYTPYRFRGADGSITGYRDRFGPFHWVNTVYHRPITPVRQAPVVTPGRRLKSPIADPAGDREADAPRTEHRTIEARRVVEPRDRGNVQRQKESRVLRDDPGGRRNELTEEPRAEPAPVERRSVDRPERVREDRPEARPSRESERREMPAREARPAREVERAPAREAPQRREATPRSGDGGGRRRGR